MIERTEIRTFTKEGEEKTLIVRFFFSDITIRYGFCITSDNKENIHKGIAIAEKRAYGVGNLHDIHNYYEVLFVGSVHMHWLGQNEEMIHAYTSYITYKILTEERFKQQNT